MPVWDDVLGEQERLVVDVIYNFIGDKPEPILESIKRWRYSCGEVGWEGVRELKRLIDAARERQIPIFYTGMDRRPDGFDQGAWNWKSHRAAEATDVKGSLGNEIVAEVAPQPQDVL